MKFLNLTTSEGQKLQLNTNMIKMKSAPVDGGACEIDIVGPNDPVLVDSDVDLHTLSTRQELQVRSLPLLLSAILQSPDFLTHIIKQSDGKILSQVLVREAMILTDEIVRQTEGGTVESAPEVQKQELKDSFFGSKIKIQFETNEAPPAKAEPSTSVSP